MKSEKNLPHVPEDYSIHKYMVMTLNLEFTSFAGGCRKLILCNGTPALFNLAVREWFCRDHGGRPIGLGPEAPAPWSPF